MKNYDLEQAIEDVSSMASDDTILLPLLNGITASEELKKAFPNNRVLLGLSMGIDAIRTKETIHYTDLGVVQFGYERNDPPAKEIVAIMDYLDDAGVPVKVYPDMKRMQWKKWMLNVGINQATAITMAKFKHLSQNPELLTLFKGAMLEVLALAEAEHVDLTIKDVNAITERMLDFTPEGKTSMFQDVEARRRTEIDFFAGTVLSYGKKHKIKTPVNEMLYYSIKAREQVYLSEEKQTGQEK